ncbi:MAG: transporter, sugar porter family [Mycobacterium sp.]|nr:transporter, sugar porter family [Mycobacterium sp.]
MQGFSIAPIAEGPLAEVPRRGLRRVWRWSIVISLGGLLFGYDTGVISGALLFIKTEFHLSPFQQGSVVSALLLGAMLGALGSGPVSDRLGRRTVFGIIGAIFVIGTAVAVFSTGYWMLLAARFILGVGVGAASATVPVYLSEVSPTDVRGRMMTVNQLMLTSGILISYLVNLLFSHSGNWRAMFAVGGVPALVMTAGALWLLPESPQWLIMRGRTTAAIRVMALVTDTDTARRLLEKHMGRAGAATDDRVSTGRRKGWLVLLEPRVRPALIVGLTLAAVQQFCGINTIIYYAPTIIGHSGLTASNSIFYSTAVGFINLVMTVVAIRLIDRAGRRLLLLSSLGGMTVTLGLLGLSFVGGWGALASLVFMVLYIAFFAVGMGPVFWVLLGEIFPPDARAEGSGASTAVNWASNFVVSLAFLNVVNAIGQGQTFWIFAAICVGALIFSLRYVPETKNREFREVDAALQRRFGRSG